MKRILFIGISFLFSFRSPASADQISVQNDQLFLTCDQSQDCEKICQASTCLIANLTCAACAKSSDPALLAIFRSFHLIYQTSPTALSKATLGNWMSGRNILALPADSPLNIFADPFSSDDQAVVQSSFDQVCRSQGRHFVLAEVGKTLKPQAVICETKPSQWNVMALQFRPDYFQPNKNENSDPIILSQP